MAVVALRGQLNTLVTSILAMGSGMLDEYFQYLQSMDEDGSSAQGLVAEVINLFIASANRILNDITGLLNQPVIDVNKVDDLVHQLKWCISSDYEAIEWAFKYWIGLSTVEASKITLFNFLQKENDNIVIVHGAAVEEHGYAKLAVFFNKKHVLPYGFWTTE
ncbi:histidine-containing phosphotransfer protein 2-like [Triticum urartu]|uniref:histidine-containing phosphotransfer protein 2-like n=1 Tax=Triticum urartu TaxID=4572 RepID=UPI002043BB26|nr:histidine-containing phosphotransfer protein 2-like [Triticum urartu]